MTVTVVNIVAGPYTATGEAQNLPYSFKVFTPEEIEVVVGADRTPVDPSLYTVTRNLAVDGQVLEGGSVSLGAGAVEAGASIHLIAKPFKTQELYFSDTGSRLRNLNEVADRAALRALRAQYDGMMEGAGQEILAAAAEAGAEAGAAASSGKLDRNAGNADPTFSDNAPYKPPIPATYTRAIGERFNEQRSVLDFMPYAVRQDVLDRSYMGDVNALLQAAVDSGEKRLFLPNAELPIDTDGWSLTMTVPGQVLNGAGAGSVIRNRVIDGTPARPALIVATGADFSQVNDISIHVNTQKCVNPTAASGQIAMGCGVIFMADNSVGRGLMVYDSWDNCIGIGRFDMTTGQQSNSAPKSVVIEGARTWRGGSGIQMQGELPFCAGSGVNNLTGHGTRIINCYDWYSSQNFINDYAGGAEGMFIGCHGFYARKRYLPGVDWGSAERTPGGQGFYVADRATIIGCEIFEPDADGIWMDGFSFYCTIRDFHVKAAKQRGALIQGRDHTIDNLHAEWCSYQSPGVWDAIELRGQAATSITTFTDSTNINLINPRTEGDHHRYGVNTSRGGGDASGRVFGTMFGGSLNGTAGPFNSADPAIFQATGYREEGTNDAVRSTGLERRRRSNKSWKTEAFGDYQSNGHLFLEDATVQTKRLALGFDPVNNVSVIQSIHTGVSPLPLLLNPNGGGAFVTGKVGSATSGYGAAFNPAGLSVLLPENNDKRVSIGYTMDDEGVVQALADGVGPRPLALNPSGGAVRTGAGHWNAPVTFKDSAGNPVHLFFDDVGRPYFKPGAKPTSLSDGNPMYRAS